MPDRKVELRELEFLHEALWMTVPLSPALPSSGPFSRVPSGDTSACKALPSTSSSSPEGNTSFQVPAAASQFTGPLALAQGLGVTRRRSASTRSLVLRLWKVFRGVVEGVVHALATEEQAITQFHRVPYVIEPICEPIPAVHKHHGHHLATILEQSWHNHSGG